MSTNEPKHLACRLCGASLTHRFNLPILGKYDAKYFECSDCHSLQTEEAYWLDEAYSRDLPNLDTGAVQRNLNNFAFCYTFAKIFDVRTAVDFGASDGLLCRFLRDHGVDCYAYDRYAQPSYARDFTSPPKGNIDLLTAFEVLEHLPHPAKDLEEIFSFRPRYVLCSTELYANQPSDWWYLANEGGQHIFFYSVPAINLIAEKYDYGVAQIGGMLLFFRPDTPNIQNMLVAAQTALSGWIFQAIKSYVFLLPAGGVQNDFALVRAKASQQRLQ
jgi:hypothetical protein